MNELTPEIEQQCWQLIDEFWQWFDTCYGLYRDAHEAFPEYAKAKRALVEQNRLFGDMREEDFIISYPRLQKPGENQVRHIHQADLPSVIARNAHEGLNTKFIGRMMIVAVYSFWEDHTRRKLQEILGGKLQAPIWGEIAALRRAIIHDQSRSAEAKKLTILQGFTDGDSIDPTERLIGQIVDQVWQFCGEFKNAPLKFVVEWRK